MSQSPFQSPQTSSTPLKRPQKVDLQWQAFGQRRKRRFVSLDRPPWVTRACIFQLVVVPVVMFRLIGSNLNGIINVLTALHISAGAYLCSFLFFCVVGIVSGLAMLGGSPWSWWLGTFFQIYIVLNYILETVLLRLFAPDLLRLSVGDFFFISVRIPIMLMFFVYFFTDDVFGVFRP